MNYLIKLIEILERRTLPDLNNAWKLRNNKQFENNKQKNSTSNTDTSDMYIWFNSIEIVLHGIWNN